MKNCANGTMSSEHAERCIRLLVAVLVLLAGTAAAQTHGSHMQPDSGSSASGTSVDEFAKQLSSDDSTRRLEAVKSLGASRDGKAIAPLIQALGDPDLRVQARAIQSLGDMRATEATPVLLQSLLLRTTGSNMKQLILASLGKIGDVRAAQPLSEFLQGDLDAATRGTAVFALGEIGAPESADTLDRFAQADEDPAVRRLAKEAKSKIEGRRGVTNSQEKDVSEVFLGPKGAPRVQQSQRHQH